MVGSKIPVLEVERLSIDKDGRGLILPLEGDNISIGEYITTIPASSSAAGWVRVRYTSGSTYGATGSTLYLPLYTSIN